MFAVSQIISSWYWCNILFLLLGNCVVINSPYHGSNDNQAEHLYQYLTSGSHPFPFAPSLPFLLTTAPFFPSSPTSLSSGCLSYSFLSPHWTILFRLRTLTQTQAPNKHDQASLTGKERLNTRHNPRKQQRVFIHSNSTPVGLNWIPPSEKLERIITNQIS